MSGVGGPEPSVADVIRELIQPRQPMVFRERPVRSWQTAETTPEDVLADLVSLLQSK